VSEQRVQSIERAIDILIALSDDPRTLTEVARATGLPKGTAFRLLSSLGHENLVVKAPESNLYMLGPGFLRVIQGVLTGIGAITRVAKPALTSLWDETRETVAIHVRVGAERVCVEELPSPQPIRYMSDVGLAVPLWIGSAGKVLLAFMKDADREKVLSTLTPGPQLDGTPFELEAFRKELVDVRRRGWATSSGERIVGAAAVSVPIQAGPGFLASLSVLGPTTRLSRKRRVDLVPALQETAGEIEVTLAASNIGRPSPLEVAAT
jgi:DNA-binding IclR family transcriptional regulator